MEPTQLPPDPSHTSNDGFLEDLAALTGMLNPEVIWQQEEKLDELEEAVPDADALGSERPAD